MKRAIAGLIAGLVLGTATLVAGTTSAQAEPQSTVAYRQNISGVGSVTYVFSGAMAAYAGGVFNHSLGGTRTYSTGGRLYAAWYSSEFALSVKLYASSAYVGHYMVASVDRILRKNGFRRTR